MRIVFAGTPEFAAKPLQALLDAGADVVAVYTQPDRPAGRGRKAQASAVKQVAEAAALPVCQPASLRDNAAQAELAAWNADVMVVIAYGLILPQAVLDIPRRGCVNLHASLLPRWRGAAPIQRAIEAGDAQTGLCLMQMEAGLDTGPVLTQATLPIEPQQTGGELHDALVALAQAKLPAWLRQLDNNELVAQLQDDSQACYAHKLSKAEAQIDWRRPAAELERQVRAFNPWPVAWSPLAGQAVKFWELDGQATEAATAGAPGEVLGLDENVLRIACGEGVLRVKALQFPGARRMSVAEAARGRQFLGQCFESI